MTEFSIRVQIPKIPMKIEYIKIIIPVAFMNF